VLFGYDVAEFDFNKDLDFISLLETFGTYKIANLDALPIITSMLQHGLKDILKNQEDPDSPLGDPDGSPLRPLSANVESSGIRSRSRSMSLQKELESRRKFSGPFPFQWLRRN
jgi:hypothetical protein